MLCDLLLSILLSVGHGIPPWYLPVFHYSIGVFPFTPEILHSPIRDSQTAAIIAQAGARPDLRYNNIYDNAHGVLQQGIVASEMQEAVDARFTWWGHESGPYSILHNPNGKGDLVQGSVDINPWAETRVSQVPSDSYLYLPFLAR